MNNTIKPVTTPVATTPVTIPVATTPATTPKIRVIGSMKVGVDTSDIKFKTLADLKRDFGDNWV